MAYNSLGLAHIEHVRSEQSDTSSRTQDAMSSSHEIELGSLSARASLEATSAIKSPRHENAAWYWRPTAAPDEQTLDNRQSLLETSGAASSATSMVDPDSTEHLARMSSRSLLPHRTRDEEEADLGLYALEPQLSARSARRGSRSISRRRPSNAGVTHVHKAQGKPAEFPNLLAELTCVLVCSMGQLFFSIFIGNTRVNMLRLVPVLGIQASQTPWLDGSFMLANGLSVIIFGSMADLASPRTLVIGAFAWSTIWNIVGAFSMTPERVVLFFMVRAMQGLAVGVLVSTAMSILGRVYSPGVRKTRVFSAMAAAAPFGFWIGALQGGALSSHLPWIFGSNAILSALLCGGAYLTVPKLSPAKDSSSANAPSLRNFDYLGAACAAIACVCLLFGLTQGSAARWTPYTYSLVLVGFVFLATFIIVENKVQRPLIPNGLWKIPGFGPLALAYFLGFGSYVGGWQFYAVQFWLRIQHATPMEVALYLTPNAIAGVLATWVVSVTLHKFPGHWILAISMVAYALGPVFFLPQTASTSYWALSLPGIFLVTFGPDMSFAACSVFITSSVPRSYQGSAGSVLVTVQNLSGAVIASLADTIGIETDAGPGGEIGLHGLRVIWWFSFALAIAAAVITLLGVRIPKTEEKEHVT